MRRAFLPLLLCCATALPVTAQFMAPVGVDLFGDDIVRKLHDDRTIQWTFITPLADQGPAADYAHTLVFQDGRQLRGSVTEVTKDHVVWSRPDAQPALRFSRNEIRRIVFSSKPPAEPEPFPPANREVPATLKLPGADWVFGYARAENGEDFTVTIAPDAALKFPRAAVEWIHFGKNPAPGFGFSGEPLGMEGWMFGNPSAPVEVTDGVFKSGSWIGRNISPPERFEVDFEVPEGGEATRLWLQPYGPSPNSYSTGTVELSFGQKELGRLIFFNRFERERTPMPQGANPTGRIRYRVFYDSPGGRLIVMRNTAVVGEWKLRDENDPAAARHRGERTMPKGIAFDRGNSIGTLALARLRMQPWDGVIPKGEEAPEPRMIAGPAPKPGKLDSISDSELRFGGAKESRDEGVFVHLGQEPAGLMNSEALVTFGARGELAIAGITVRDGRLTGRTAGIANLDLPVNLIHSVVFPQRKVEPPKNEDVLVFRNGDSISGHLMTAANGAAVRWRAENGQELQFKAEHVAGVRIGGSVPAEVTAGATVELLSGDRIRGELLSFAGDLRLRHQTLGERSLPRSALRTVYPNPKALIMDAGCDPESWLGIANRGRADLRNILQNREAGHGRVFLDGAFLSPPSHGSRMNFTGVSRALDKLERYELRCAVTDAGGAEPYLTGSLSGNNGTPSLQINLGHGQLRVYSYNTGGGRGRAFQQEREVSLADKLPEQRSRRELRLFVDTKVGTVDFMVDGVHLLRFGQQKNERAPGLGSQVSLSSYPMNGNVSVLSNIWLGPWNGDVPRAGELSRGVSLKNGDVAPGAIGPLADGKIQVGEGADAIEIPMDRIISMEFGADPSPERPAARIRFTDGTVMNLRDFSWENGQLRGDSAAFGAVDAPARAIRELILSPAPARFPQLAESKKLARKGEPQPPKELP